MKTKFFTLVLCLICLLSLVGCSVLGNYTYPSKYVDFEVVETCGHNASTIAKEIWVDKTTGVLYYFVNAGQGKVLTPLYNADGSLKNIKDFE